MLCSGGGETGGQTKFDVRHPGHFDDHNSQVWRVAWNATGTVLASSGDDGHVRLWKGRTIPSHCGDLIA